MIENLKIVAKRNSSKLDKIPEYLRETVDWFMGKARRKEKDVISDDSKLYLQEELLQCLAVEMKLVELATLPKGMLPQEWIASHTIAFFDHINLIYGTISEFCTMSGCPEMNGPCNKLYFWMDERSKRSKMPAPHYIDYVMTYMQKTLNDESIFPTKFDKDFPCSFEMIVRKMYRLLFHVLAHIYHMHFNEIVILGLHSHLNCIFAHLFIFNQQFNLIDSKETEVLHDLAIALKLTTDNQSEPMQCSTPASTPEPPANSPISTSFQQRIDKINDRKTKAISFNELDLQNINTAQEQKQLHLRQNSFTANQTISSTYIKRFVSSLSTNSANQCSAMEEDIGNNLNNVINTNQCKNLKSSTVNDLGQNEEMICEELDENKEENLVQSDQSLKNNCNENKSHKNNLFRNQYKKTNLKTNSGLNTDLKNVQSFAESNKINLRKEQTENEENEFFSRRSTSASAILLPCEINHKPNESNRIGIDYQLDKQMGFNLTDQRRCISTENNEKNHNLSSTSNNFHHNSYQSDSDHFNHSNNNQNTGTHRNPNATRRNVCALIDSNSTTTQFLTG